jgi:hypothetical protein
MLFSFRFVRTLLNLISVLRPYWKCLQNLNDTDAAITLEKYLENWHEQNRKDIAFFDPNNKPKEFPLFGFYDLYADAENARLDKVIEDIIQSTDLSVPKSKICFCSDDKQLDRLKFSRENCSRVLAASDQRCVFNLIENLANRHVNQTKKIYSPLVGNLNLNFKTHLNSLHPVLRSLTLQQASRTMLERQFQNLKE